MRNESPLNYLYLSIIDISNQEMKPWRIFSVALGIPVPRTESLGGLFVVGQIWTATNGSCISSITRDAYQTLSPGN